MYLRTTPALETLLSCSRPVAPRSTSRSRLCLLPHLPGSRAQITISRSHAYQRRRVSAAPASTDLQRIEARDGMALESHQSTSGPEPDSKSWRTPYGLTSASVNYHPLRALHMDTFYESRWKKTFGPHFHAREEQRAHGQGLQRKMEQRASATKFASGCTAEQIQEKWTSMSNFLRYYLLPDILIGCLLIGPDLTLRVLEGLPSLKDDFTIRMDCLLKLRREPKLWSQIRVDARNGLMERFRSQLDHQRCHGSLRRYSLNAGHAQLILENCTAEQAARFFDRYLRTYSDRHVSILCSFVDAFTRLRDSKQALRALQHIPAHALEGSDPSILQRCTNLLKLETIDANTDSKNFKILPQLLELGIKPDTITHNMIIMNAIRHDVPRVAWDLYEYLQTENLPTDAATHLLLMKDAFARQDVSGLNAMLSAIHKRKDLYHNPYLVGCTMNIVRIIYVWERGTGPLETFSHVLSIHNRAWTPDIYISLNMIPRSEANGSSNAALPAPPPQVLAWTIFQYCLIQQDSNRVDRLWSSLLELIANQHPLVAPAAHQENLYGGFIVFYGRSPRTLGKAVDIVQHMLESSHCEPTGLTWMRLLCAYLRQGQQREAEQIRRVMMRRGIDLKGKEFAYLLEKWPGTEVAERARRAMLYPEDKDEMVRPGRGQQEMLSEELFEGVPMPAKSAQSPDLPVKKMIWDDLVDPWTQDMGGASPEDRETMKSLRATPVSA